MAQLPIWYRSRRLIFESWRWITMHGSKNQEKQDKANEVIESLYMSAMMLAIEYLVYMSTRSTDFKFLISVLRPSMTVLWCISLMRHYFCAKFLVSWEKVPGTFCLVKMLWWYYTSRLSRHPRKSSGHAFVTAGHCCRFQNPLVNA